MSGQAVDERDGIACTGVSARRRILGVDVEVLLLGVVSFLTDVSSEAIFSVLPIFLASVLGASTLVIGAIEGLADFASSSLDLVSGWLSDRSGRRKPFAVAGYGFSTVAKALLVFASGAGQVLAFRVVERLGKSIRGAPRDALLAAIAAKEVRGASFGVHKALDRAGAVLGPLVAYAILDRAGASAEAFRRLFAVALAPAALAVLVLALAVRERVTPKVRALALAETWSALGARFRGYVRVAAVFSLGYSSFAFLLLAAGRAGFEAKDVALLYALLNGSFAVVSIPIGRLGDRIGRRALILASYLLYAVVAIGFAVTTSKAGVVALFVLYGVFFAIDEGQTKAYVADLAPPERRATAIGILSFATGLAYVAASLIAGALWSVGGPPLAFGFAAAVAAVAAALFAHSPRAPESARPRPG